jgi:hypothetical protein
MGKEYLSINAPQRCCFCLAEAVVRYESPVVKNPCGPIDDVFALMLPVCRKCRSRARWRWGVYMGSSVGVLAVGVVASLVSDSPGPLVASVLGARNTAQLVGGMVLSLVCGALIAAFGPR